MGWCWLYDSILDTSQFEKQNYYASCCILIYSNFRLLAQDTDPECRLLAQHTDPECLGFAIRFPAHPKWSTMIGDMKGVFPTCLWVQRTPHLATDFSRRTWSTKYWAVGWCPYLSNQWAPLEVHAGAAWPHSERWPAGTPGPGSQTLSIPRSIHHFDTTYLTPTDGS